MDINRWKSQLRKGAAELVVLALLETKPSTGVALLDALENHPDIGISDGAMYPLLQRLEREGRIMAKWQIPNGGERPIKIYTLQPDGKKALKQMRSSWALFSNDVTKALGEGS